MQNDCVNIYQSARKIAGLTQERAAELLGLSARSLADYEAGLRLPPHDVADRIVEKIRTIAAAAIALASVPRGG